MSTATIASESGHWYYPNGDPCYEITGKNGKQRPTDLRDARRLGLYPSVTTVMQVIRKPALEIWQQRQVLLAALTLPRAAHPEQDDALVDRIIADAKEQARKAAEHGTAIHAAIERALCGALVDPEHQPYVDGIAATLEANLGSRSWSRERSYSSAMRGYGGKLDLHDQEIVVDIKGKDTAADFVLYDEHAIQLAAYQNLVCEQYAHTMDAAATRGGILFYSRTEPGVCAWREFEPEDLDRGWRMFSAALDLWKLQKRYDPTEVRR